MSKKTKRFPSASPVSSEATAARALLVERDRRAGNCLADIQAALARHNCSFQVVVQDLMIPGQAGTDRRCQVNVAALDPAPAPAPPGVAEIEAFHRATQAANGKPAA